MSESFYRVYGLVCKVDIPIPILSPLAPPPSVDVNIWLANSDSAPVEFPGADSSIWKSHPGFIDRRYPASEDQGWRLQVLLSEDEQYISFHYSDDTKFIFTHDGTQIWAQWREDITVPYVVAYLLNPVMGFLLRLRHRVCLHASGMIVGGKALLLCGASGVGKSTTAGYFAMRGHTVITDDIGVLAENAGQIGVEPGYPQLRLQNRTTAALLGSVDALPQVVPNWSKRYLDLQGPDFGFASQVTPVGAVYIISEWGESPQIHPFAQGEALYELLKTTYMSYLLDSTLRKVDFALLSRLVQSIPVKRLISPQGLKSLPDLYNTLLSDYANSTALTLEA